METTPIEVLEHHVEMLENVPEIKRLIQHISLLRIPTNLERVQGVVIDKNKGLRDRLIIKLEKLLNIYDKI